MSKRPDWNAWTKLSNYWSAVMNNSARTLLGMLEVRSLGRLRTKYLPAMKKLAVREENMMVTRATLHNMIQDRGKLGHAYGARLRGEASVCKFTQEFAGYDATVDYTESTIKDVLCRGLQMDLLGDRNQDMTLEQVLSFVKVKEAGKRSASRLLLPQARILWPAAHTGSRRSPSQRTHC